MRRHLDIQPGQLGPEGAFRDEHIRLLKDRFGLRIHARRGRITLQGEDEAVERGAKAILSMVEAADRGADLSDERVDAICRFHQEEIKEGGRRRHTPPAAVAARSAGQEHYLESMRAHTVTFATGPAGTGKTFLAVGMAVQYLLAGQVERIVLVRPAVEAGEKLGFLPGDLQEKIRPYLLPIHDALRFFLGPSRLENLQERGTIEVAPLAYMRGRTLDGSFMILDEAQNTTVDQMKMFLTRIGRQSRAVVTGDPSQIDLGDGEISGLAHACRILREVEDLCFVELSVQDIVRHPVVGAIVLAYERSRHGQETLAGQGRRAQ